MDIIIKGKTPQKKPLEGKTLDELHSKRKKLVEEMKDGLYTKDQMNWRDCPTEADEQKRVRDYDRWKDTKVKGTTNEQKMREWSDINKEMKRRKEEGRIHSIDDLRKRKSVKYD